MGNKPMKGVGRIYWSDEPYRETWEAEMVNVMQQMVEGNTLIKLEKEESRLRIGGGSWTINLDLLPPEVEKIEYRTRKARYTIDLSVAKEKGFERTFQGENKLVVPIKSWTTHETSK